MSVNCKDCGAVAGQGRELGHYSDCPRLKTQIEKEAKALGKHMVKNYTPKYSMQKILMVLRGMGKLKPSWKASENYLNVFRNKLNGNWKQ